MDGVTDVNFAILRVSWAAWLSCIWKGFRPVMNNPAEVLSEIANTPNEK